MGDRPGKLGILRKIAARVLVEPEPQASGPDPLMVMPGMSELTADVILDSDAQPRLARMRKSPAGPGGGHVFAYLTERGDGKQLEIRSPAYRLGTLSAADNAAFRGSLDKAKSQGRRVVVMALGEKDASGTWALRIYLPHPKPGQDRPAAP